VENMRVGDRTDYDRLFLEVETDGTLSPESAFTKASEIIINHFSMLGTAFVAEVAAQEKAEESKAARKEKKETVKKTTKKKAEKKAKKK
jgi:DNA-directed RNA polymerase subunit alpha